MPTRLLAVAFAGFGLLATAGASEKTQAPGTGASPDQITGESYQLERAYLVTVHVPNAEVEKILAALAAAVRLDYGMYDQVAFLDAPGLEQFRPLEGSKSGEEATATREPTTSLTFSVPQDSTVLRKALDAVYVAHSYEEPVIYISEVWRTRSTDPDNANPNRWWNREPQ